MSDAQRDKLLEKYDRNQERLRNYRAGKGGFEDIGSVTADRSAQALDDSYAKDGYGGHGWYEKLRRERDEDRGQDKDYSGAKDYSSPSNQKTKNVADKLRNGELGKNETKTSERDIGKQERGPWNDNTGSSLGSAVKNAKSPNQGSFFVRHKKGLIGWIIGLTMGAGMFGVTTLLSGPAQWIQVANFIKDTVGWIHGAQTGARYLHNMRTLARWENAVSDSIQNSRLGIVSKRLSNTAIKRMEAQGMTFGNRWSGNAPSITIDTTKRYGDLFNQDARGGTVSDALHEKRVNTLSEKYGVDSSKVHLSSDGKLTVDFDSMSYREARKFINATNDVGKFSIMGQVQTRMALKKVGKISWLHPIRKLEAKVANKFADWLKGRLEKIAKNGFSSADEAAAAAAKKAENAASRAGKSADDIAKAGEKAAEAARKSWTQAVKEAAEEISTKIIKLVVKEAGGKVSVAAVKAAIPIVGWITLAIQAYCMIVAMDDGIGAEKYQNVVTVAQGDAAETLGIASQVMTGHGQDEDLSMEALGNYTKLKLYNDEIEEVSPTTDPTVATENNGYETVGKTSSSWWSAAPVQAGLGQQPSTTALNNVPAALNDVTNSGLSFGGSKDLQTIWNTFSSTLEFAAGGLLGAAMKAMGLPTPMDAVCWVFDQVDEIIGGALSWILENTGLMALLTGLPFMDALANLMNNIMGWLRGTPLDIATATPQQFGSINMYGEVFASNEQMLAVGGTAMSSTDQAALELEQKQYLAEQQAQKPLLARLFDPTDYNSTIAQIGRAADINTSDQSIGTQLKNVGKIFASVPKLFSYAIGRIGGSASAASPIAYNYNVPMIAFSQSEMEKITSEDSGYDMIPNAQKVYSMIDSGEITSDKTKKCWGIEVSGAPDYKITQVDNSAGAAWNYGDNYGEDGDKMTKNGCGSEEMLAFRTFMMDYEGIVSADCYENDGWSGGESADSCTEMGFELTSSSSSSASTSSGSSTVGTAEELIAAYDKAVPGGDYDGTYGSQCVDFAKWFIDVYTTLKRPGATGDGKLVVNNVADANGIKSEVVTNINDVVAPALFSTTNSGSSAGHVGVIVSIDGDNVTIAENNHVAPGKSGTRLEKKTGSYLTNGDWYFLPVTKYLKGAQ